MPDPLLCEVTRTAGMRESAGPGVLCSSTAQQGRTVYGMDLPREQAQEGQQAVDQDVCGRLHRLSTSSWRQARATMGRRHLSRRPPSLPARLRGHIALSASGQAGPAAPGREGGQPPRGGKMMASTCGHSNGSFRDRRRLLSPSCLDRQPGFGPTHQLAQVAQGDAHGCGAELRVQRRRSSERSCSIWLAGCLPVLTASARPLTPSR